MPPRVQRSSANPQNIQSQVANYQPQAVNVNNPQQQNQGFFSRLGNALLPQPGGFLSLPSNDPFRQNILNNLSQFGYQGATEPSRYRQLLQGLIANNNGVMGSQNLTSQFVNPGMQALQNPYQGFQEGIANPAQRNFAQNTVPSLAERFTSLGEGAQRSSGFQGALGSAASDLESQLAALRSQYGMQNRQFGLQALQGGGQYQQGRESQLQNLLGMGLTQQQNQFGNYANLLQAGLTPSFQYGNQQGSTGILAPIAKLGTQLAMNYFLPGSGALMNPNNATAGGYGQQQNQIPGLSINRLGGVA